MKRRSPIQRRTALARTRMVKRRLARTAEEARARQLVAARSGGQCELDAADPATDMHHRKNRSQGGAWAPSNLLHICREHHTWITTHPVLACKQGWAVRRGGDPATVPARLAQGWALLDDLGRATSTHLEAA